MLSCSSGVSVSVARRVRPVIHTHRHRARYFAATGQQRDSVKRDSNGRIDVEALLAKPTWSVASLLPTATATASTPDSTPKVTSRQLNRLLRLSALPPPSSPEEEEHMLSTLSSQLHFVKEIQRVDTTGLEPLRSLRDETAEGEREQEVGVDRLREALGKEEAVGGKFVRVKRKRVAELDEAGNGGANGNGEEKWDPLGTAGRKTGRYFVVEGGKDG